jgi:vitellogenic carboxypeptidase-like protein
VRAALHAGNRSFGGDAGVCEKHLLADFHVSMMGRLEHLLTTAKYDVLLYSGQLDVIIGAALTEAFMPLIEWPGKDAFAAAKKTLWKVAPTDEEYAGFVRDGGGLKYAIIRGAGHIAPYDQPRASLDMVTRFIEGTPF